MRPEYDMRGGVRGKYLARYRRWTALTTATGTVEVSPVTTGEPSSQKIAVVIAYQPVHVVPRAIAQEVLTSASA